MRFDGMIFDIEGTLIDCIPQNLRSWQETLFGFGLTVPLDVLQLYSGMDGDDMLRIIAPDRDKDYRKRVLEAEGKNFEARYLGSVQAFTGIRPLFEAIKRAGGRIAIATDCTNPALSHYREVLGVDDLIDVIACGEDVKEGKPSPKLVRLAAKRLGVDPARAVMTGDTPYDAEAALGAAAPRDLNWDCPVSVPSSKTENTTPVPGISKNQGHPLAGVELLEPCRVSSSVRVMEAIMGFGRGALLWLIGIPLPIILLLAVFMHH